MKTLSSLIAVILALQFALVDLASATLSDVRLTIKETADRALPDPIAWGKSVPAANNNEALARTLLPESMMDALLPFGSISMVRMADHPTGKTVILFQKPVAEEERTPSAEAALQTLDITLKKMNSTLVLEHQEGGILSRGLQKETSRAEQTLRAFERVIAGLLDQGSSSLRAYEDARRRYHDGDLELTDYAFFLENMARISTPELKKVLDAALLEKSLDFMLVEKERRTLLESLLTSLNKDELKKLWKLSRQFQSGQVSSGRYFEHIKTICKNHGLGLEKSAPELLLYIQYVQRTESIDTMLLEVEIASAEKTVENAVCAGAADREALRLASDHIFLKKLTEARLDDTEWAQFNDRLQAFQDLPERLRAIAITPPLELVSAAQVLSASEGLYDAAASQNGNVAERLASKLRNADAHFAAYVTGGSRCRAIADRLVELNVNVLVVSPQTPSTGWLSMDLKPSRSGF